MLSKLCNLIVAASALVTAGKESSEWSLFHRSSTAAASPRACGVLWFYHIPKTGGESVNSWLFDMKAHNQFDEVYVLHNISQEVDVNSFMKNELESVIDKPEGKLVAVHHHDRARGLYNMTETFTAMKRRLEAKGCNLYRMTFLRDPMEHLKAALVFYDSAERGEEWVAPGGVSGISDSKERFRKALSTDAIYDNILIRYLLNNLGQGGPNPRVANAGYPMTIGSVDDKAMTLARDILREFQFVGFVDDTMTPMVDIMAKKLGLNNTAVGLPHLNVYGINQVNMAANTDAAELAQAGLDDVLDKRTRFDRKLYEIVRAERGFSQQ